MKRVAFSLVVAAGLATSTAFAADMAVKAPPAPAVAAPPPWDISVTAALMTDYNFRGVTQSAHQPSTQATFEPRYNFNSNWQGYVGLSGESIDFPNRAAAEIDIYGGIRPTFDKLALDFGGWYYWYPGGQCFNTPGPCEAQGGGNSVGVALPNGNVVKRNVSFFEGYGKFTYTVNDSFNFGGSIWGSPSVLNSGAPGIFYAGTATINLPSAWFSNGVGAYISADGGWWQLGTSDSFYAVAGFPNGVPYKSYASWDVGLAFTWKAFTLDLRYYDSNLNKGDCNAFTSDHTAAGVFSTAINPGGPASNWCQATFIAKLTFNTLISALK